MCRIATMCDLGGDWRVQLSRAGDSAARQRKVDDQARGGWQLVASPLMEADPETEALIFKREPPKPPDDDPFNFRGRRMITFDDVDL
jgi:hypothetical protein